jgi:hypothetical protein
MKSGRCRSLAAVIALTGGSLLLSDDLSAVPEERRRIAEVLLPPIGQRAEVIDWFDRVTPQYLRLKIVNATGSYNILGWFNWEDQPRNITLRPTDFRLSGQTYLTREFWCGKICMMSENSPYEAQKVPAHGSVVLAVREMPAGNQPQYVGSDVHISQGNEISRVDLGERSVKFCFDQPRQMAGKIALWLPGPPIRVTVNGKPSPWNKADCDGVVFVEVYFDRSGSVAIDY